MNETIRIALAVFAASFFCCWGVSVLILNGLEDYQDTKILNYLLGMVFFAAAFCSWEFIK